MEQKQTETPTLKMDPKLRTTAMINSGILALQFGIMTYAMISAGQTFIAILGLIGTIGTVSDTVKFYYVNKEN